MNPLEISLKIFERHTSGEVRYSLLCETSNAYEVVEQLINYGLLDKEEIETILRELK